MVGKFIESHALLSGLSTQNQEKLSQASKLRVLEAGDAVFREGEVRGNCYAMSLGTIKVFQNSMDGKEIIVKMLAPGDILGEVALFDQGPYPASAIAISPSTIIEIEGKHFLKLLDETQFRNDFIKNILTKLRYLTGKVYSLMAYDIEERFFRYLISEYGIRQEYQIYLSKKDFASAIGTIPETFSRLLARLKDRGDIEWIENTLKVKQSILKNYISEL